MTCPGRLGHSEAPTLHIVEGRYTMFVWESYRAAKASLRKFAPEWRARHRIVRFWSTERQKYRYGRQLINR